MNLSYWEKSQFLSYDHIIIGSGITGLSAAIRLKEIKPESKVAVLERGVFPTGASTKNAGFACFGSLTEIIDDLQNMSSSECLSLIEKRWKGLKLLRHNLGDKNIAYQACGGYELIEASQEKQLERLDEINEFLMPILGHTIFELSNQKIREFGFPENKVCHLISNSFEGSVNTGLLMQTLIKKATSLGVSIYNGVNVTKWEYEQNTVKIYTSNNIIFRSKQLGICTNAFAKVLMPEMDIRPGRGLVLVTKPLQNIPFNGVFHFDSGYCYFREIENRIILGGGRNMDFKNESTTEFGINPLIQKDLEDKLNYIVAPKLTPEIDYFWSGIMAFGPNKTILSGRLNSRVSYALRLGGMGIAIGTLMGNELAEEMIKE